MPLPILNGSVSGSASNEDLVRLYHRCELRWSQGLSEGVETDVGMALFNKELNNIYDANRMFSAALPEAGDSPQDVFDAVQQIYSDAGCRCYKWVMNPAAPGERTAPLIQHLLSIGYAPQPADIMHLARLTAPNVPAPAHMKIFPARASFRHVRELAEHKAAMWKAPQMIEASVQHLDDPHYDALIATIDGKAVASIGVLAVGELGTIEQVYVIDSMRGQGVARVMMSRAMEICARSLFKHVMLSVVSGNEPAVRLYMSFGFKKVGEIIEYASPGTVHL